MLYVLLAVVIAGLILNTRRLSSALTLRDMELGEVKDAFSTQASQFASLQDELETAHLDLRAARFAESEARQALFEREQAALPPMKPVAKTISGKASSASTGITAAYDDGSTSTRGFGTTLIATKKKPAKKKRK